MNSKKSLSRLMAGGRADFAQVFNVSFPAAGATYDGGDVWPFRDIKRGLERNCDNVEELRADAANNRRSFGATIRKTPLRFVAIMTHANGRRDDITEMLYAARFTGGNIDDKTAEAIDRHLEITLAYADEGDLYLLASPKIFGRFDPQVFDAQLGYFLDDLRSAARLLFDDGTTSRAAAGEIRSMMAADPAMAAFANRLDSNRFHAEAVSMFSARHDCDACNGKGKRLFRSCAECDGRGYRR